MSFRLKAITLYRKVISMIAHFWSAKTVLDLWEQARGLFLFGLLALSASSQLWGAPPSTVVSLGGPALPAGLDDIVAIAAGYGQQLAVRSNGTVVVLNNTLPGNPQPPATLSNVIAVASGAFTVSL
jgi:hypothetical protein